MESESAERSSSRRQPLLVETRDQLARILASPAFQSSARRKALLHYLVEEALAGRADRLKGYTIGVDVFGLGETFDPKTDPFVRLEARRLRRDLDGYYANAGARDPVRISVPKGAYVPLFEWQDAAGASASPADTPGEPETRPVAAVGRAGRKTTPRRFRGFLAPVIVGIAMLMTALGGWLWSQHRDEHSETATAAPQEHGATVIVLPFEALSADPDDKFLAAGLSQQLITDLMRFAGLKLYSVPASFRQSPTADPVDVGRNLSVAYVVKGSLRSVAGAVRLSASLVDSGSGQVLWSETYDRPLTPESVLEVQEDLTARIAARLGQPYGIVREMATNRIAKDAPRTMTAYGCVLQAYVYRRTFARELYAPVRGCLENAVRLDPRYADPWALLGWVHLDGARFGYVPEKDVASEMDQAFASASHAVDLAPHNLVSLQALSAITYYRGGYDEAEKIQREALALNPNDPETLAQLGWRLAMRGRWDEGLGYLTQAISRSIDPPPWYYFSFAMHDYIVGDYTKALVAAEKAKSDSFGVGWSLVATLQAALGNRQEAKRALAEMVARSATLSRDPAAYYRFHRLDEPIIERLVDGLRKAGWSDPTAPATAAQD